MPVERPIRVGVVTSSDHRFGAFMRALAHPEYAPREVESIARLQPLFDEREIRRTNGNTGPAYAVQMSLHKAITDTENRFKKEEGAARNILVYGDTIQLIYDENGKAKIMEKPKSAEEWLADEEYGVMAQSGKVFEVCSALTGVDTSGVDKDPQTVLVRIRGHMRPFAKNEVEDWLGRGNGQGITELAGGLSLWTDEGREFYDTKEPLEVFLQRGLEEEPVLLEKIPQWKSLSSVELRDRVYGAIPEALEMLFAKIG